MLCIALEVCECFATCVVHMHGLVGVERLFCLDFWDRGRACARGGGVVCALVSSRSVYVCVCVCVCVCVQFP
jgi:hypothetical protein